MMNEEKCNGLHLGYMMNKELRNGSYLGYIRIKSNVLAHTLVV